MRTVRFAVLSSERAVLNVLPENALPAEPNNKAQCAKSKNKGYYEAFRLVLENLAKADRAANGHPPTERAAVRRCFKNGRHGRDDVFGICSLKSNKIFVKM